MILPDTPPGSCQRLLLPSYSLLWLAALPAVFLKLLWRARRQPAYLRHLRERFGIYRTYTPSPVIWVHAVSVGETRAAAPLIRALLERYPEHSVVLTHMTPTGRETAKTLFDEEPRVLRLYLPYDFGPFAARFLRHFRPAFGIVMETELWPCLLAACQRHGVPVLLANARLSERSAQGYARIPALTRLTLGALAAVGAQSDADAARLSALGARRVSVTGNIKFDSTPPENAFALAARFRARCGARPTILAASTREGEEILILDAFLRARADSPLDVLLILTPRHPQRFDDVAAMLQARGIAMARRSADRELPEPEPLPPETRVWLGDSMGEMFAWYAAADIALIGGYWLPFGGQNPIEACAVGTPVLLGPHAFNFQRTADEAVDAGAALRCEDADAAMRTAFALLADQSTRTTMAEAGRHFAAANRGATARTLALLDEILA
ncbi:MAG: lipid IV(A) 3-deoxy-D-manno-octulosonic acid transferase [Azoarcus sp.]|jgi:3-deoxy-D-manno-octulosonic-acid transferase|nr:lipid IV(A) 3-deoxy-D-manno-octulosonic acid transferase [Azoarcus sp.]